MIEALDQLPALRTLNLQNNRIIDASQLRHCKSLTSVDLSSNLLSDVGVFDILCALPELRLCAMKGNPAIAKFGAADSAQTTAGNVQSYTLWLLLIRVLCSAVSAVRPQTPLLYWPLHRGGRASRTGE